MGIAEGFCNIYSTHKLEFYMSKVLSQTPDAIRKREARARARAAGVMEMVVAAPVAPAVVEAAIAEVAAGETFKFVGYAVDKKGRGAIRYTNDKRRTRTLVRAGCTDVKFEERPESMTKEQIDASEFIAQVVPAGRELPKAVA
jgi:hypothetical protein